MVLKVDFNRMDKSGRVSALIPDGHEHELFQGAKVLATDGEGTQCLAAVDEMGHNGLYVKLLPIGGTYRHDSEVRPSPQGVRAG